MNRRYFLSTTLLPIAGLAMGINPRLTLDNFKDVIIGHGSHQYKVDMEWGKLDAGLYPVNDCHEMVIDSKGRIVMLTNHTKNNIIIYNKQGTLVEVWGTQFPGAHGLSLNVENGEDFLYITDTERHQVIKTHIDGEVVMSLDCPLGLGLYNDPSEFQPTETAIAENGDIYVADGYGQQYILHYNAQGDLLNSFGGRGEGEQFLDNAHGICIDNRMQNSACLLVTDRMKNKLKRYTLDGKYLSTIDLPGAYICRPVIHGQEVYLATIWSYDGSSNSGFVSILDKNNQLISAPGGSMPQYENGSLNRMHQTLNIFKHPHDVCIDDQGDLYVCQWNAGQSYPIKLKRV